MKRNDKGFSLIELIVVIALMAVALTVGGMALSNITLANTKRCASELKSTMEMVRMEALKSSKDESLILSIYEDADGNVMVKVGSRDAEKIANSNVRVTYSLNGGEASELSGGGVLQFSFDRGSGAFKTMGANKILVSGAGREYELTCYSKTGKVTLE